MEHHAFGEIETRVTCRVHRRHLDIGIGIFPDRVWICTQSQSINKPQYSQASTRHSIDSHRVSRRYTHEIALKGDGSYGHKCYCVMRVA